MKQLLLGLLIAGLVAMPSALANDIAALKATSKAFNQVAKKGIAAVVNIGASRTVRQRQYAHPFYDLFGDEMFRQYFKAPQQQRQSMGSGVIVDKRGYILTNNHVIDGADEITVTLSDKREFSATIVGRDPRTDVAVLKIDAKDLPIIEVGNSDAIEVGDWAIAVGSPFGLSKSMTVGVISAKGRSNVGIVDYENFIQTDAAINPGNSGGALLNIDGELIGINTAIFTKSGGYNGIGFAIPVNLANKVMTDLITQGKVVRGWLGVIIQPITAELQEQFNLKTKTGALISDVVDDGPADEAGIKRGDIVVSFDGAEIQDSYDLRNRVGQAPVGKKVKIELVRRGKTRTVTLNISAFPQDDDTPEEADILGAEVATITRDLKNELKLKQRSGVVITDISPDSPAQRAGLRKGDIILEVANQSIYRLSDYQDVIGQLQKGQHVLVWIKRGLYSQYVVVKL